MIQVRVGKRICIQFLVGAKVCGTLDAEAHTKATKVKKQAMKSSGNKAAAPTKATKAKKQARGQSPRGRTRLDSRPSPPPITFMPSVPPEDKHDGIFECKILFNKDGSIRKIEVLAQIASDDMSPTY